MATRTWFPPRRILVPMDLGPESEAAWDYARSLAARFHGEAQPIHVQAWLLPVFGMTVIEPAGAMEAAAAAVMRLREKVGSDVVVLTDIGRADAEIERRAADYDLIVMGTHGDSGLARALRGSMAESVVRRSTTPVLVVPNRPKEVRSVLAPVNFEPYSFEAFALAAEFAAAFGAGLTVLHVAETPSVRGASLDVARRSIEAWIDRLPEGLAVRPRAVVELGDAADVVTKLAARHDLVVLAAHRRGRLSDAFGTTAERVLRRSRVPVLAVPAPAFRPRAGRPRSGHAMIGSWRAKRSSSSRTSATSRRSSAASSSSSPRRS